MFMIRPKHSYAKRASSASYPAAAVLQHGEEHKEQQQDDDVNTHGSKNQLQVNQQASNNKIPTNDVVKSSRSNTKITYLDGFRGYPILLVFGHHYLFHFFPAFILPMLDPVSRQHASNVYNGYYPTPTWNQTLLYFFIDGKIAIAIFFMLSGRVLVSSYLTADQPKLNNIISGTIRRIIRLGLPPLVMIICAWLLEKYNLSFSLEATAITKNPMGPSISYGTTAASASLEQILTVFTRVFTDSVTSRTKSENLYQLSQGSNHQEAGYYRCGILWSLHYEFLASMLLFFFVILVRGVERSRWLLYGVLIWWYHEQDFWMIPFILGMLLCDIEHQFSCPMKQALASNSWKATISLWTFRSLLAFGWFSASVWSLPFINGSSSYEARWCLGPLCAFMLLASTPGLQHIFNTQPFQFLGHISFSIYLWHFVVLYTLTDWLFLELFSHQRYPYITSAFIAIGVGLIVSLIVAYLATKLIDEPSIRLAAWIYESLFTPHSDKYIIHRSIAKLDSIIDRIRQKSSGRGNQGTLSSSRRSLPVQPTSSSSTAVDDDDDVHTPATNNPRRSSSHSLSLDSGMEILPPRPIYHPATMAVGTMTDQEQQDGDNDERSPRPLCLPFLLSRGNKTKHLHHHHHSAPTGR